ncbi:MAG: hypothetical protein IJE98_04140 [Oscillospiraceae bacterium]|nr:hypothetical protein [Oscillospiraceae bacterium]
MKVFAFLFLFLLFIGCADHSTLSSSAEAIAPLPSSSTADISTTESPFLLTADMDYFEYFSQERYWKDDVWDRMFIIEDDTLFYLNSEKDKTAYYQHPSAILNARLGDRYIFYFVAEGSVYRFFIPDKTVEKVFDGPVYKILPLSNFAFLYTLQNPENQSYDSDIGYYADDAYFIYSILTKESTQIYPADYGLDTFIGNFFLSSQEGREAVYPLPKKDP